MRIEEYDNDIEYVKGKENKVTDCLSRLFPITSDVSKQAMWEAGISDEEEETAELKNQPQNERTFGGNREWIYRRHENREIRHAFGIYKLETATYLR